VDRARRELVVEEVLEVLEPGFTHSPIVASRTVLAL
jgi:hypothetical protein